MLHCHYVYAGQLDDVCTPARRHRRSKASDDEQQLLEHKRRGSEEGYVTASAGRYAVPGIAMHCILHIVMRSRHAQIITSREKAGKGAGECACMSECRAAPSSGAQTGLGRSVVQERHFAEPPALLVLDAGCLDVDATPIVDLRRDCLPRARVRLGRPCRRGRAQVLAM